MVQTYFMVSQLNRLWTITQTKNGSCLCYSSTLVLSPRLDGSATSCTLFNTHGSAISRTAWKISHGCKSLFIWHTDKELEVPWIPDKVKGSLVLSLSTQGSYIWKPLLWVEGVDNLLPPFRRKVSDITSDVTGNVTVLMSCASPHTHIATYNCVSPILYVRLTRVQNPHLLPGIPGNSIIDLIDGAQTNTAPTKTKTLVLYQGTFELPT